MNIKTQISISNEIFSVMGSRDYAEIGSMSWSPLAA